MRSPRAILLLAVPAVLAAGLSRAEAVDGSCPPEDASGLASFASAVSSAATLASAPSAQRFADAWSTAFADAVRSVAGNDGRLSRAEVARLAARTDSSALFADDAQAWLDAHSQQSVGVDKLIRETKAAALAAAKTAAGADGKLSLEDGKKLPSTLQKDYLWLRGRLDAPASDFVAPIKAAIDGLDMTSESDARVVYLEAASSGSGAITPEEIEAAFGAQHDALMRDGSVWYSANPSYVGIADRHPEVIDADSWLSRYTQPGDPNDPASVATANMLHEISEDLLFG